MNGIPIVIQYQPKILAESLPFKEGRNLAYKMLFNEKEMIVYETMQLNCSKKFDKLILENGRRTGKMMSF